MKLKHLRDGQNIIIGVDTTATHLPVHTLAINFSLSRGDLFLLLESTGGLGWFVSPVTRHLIILGCFSMKS